VGTWANNAGCPTTRDSEMRNPGIVALRQAANNSAAFSTLVLGLWVTRPTGKLVNVAGMVSNWRRGLLQVLFPRGWDYMAPPNGKYLGRFSPSNGSQFSCTPLHSDDVPDPKFPCAPSPFRFRQ